MKRSDTALIAAALFAGVAFVSCGPPGAHPSSTGAGPATPAAEPVDDGATQRVKNLCLDRLKAEVSGANAVTGQLRAAPKVSLLRVKYLGDVREIPLSNSASGYELGIEFDYAIGHAD